MAYTTMYKTNFDGECSHGNGNTSLAFELPENSVLRLCSVQYPNGHLWQQEIVTLTCVTKTPELGMFLDWKTNEPQIYDFYILFSKEDISVR